MPVAVDMDGWPVNGKEDAVDMGFPAVGCFPQIDPESVTLLHPNTPSGFREPRALSVPTCIRKLNLTHEPTGLP